MACVLLEKTLTFPNYLRINILLYKTLFFLLEKLDPSKSAGPDEIPSRILKLSVSFFAGNLYSISQ